MKLFVLCLGLIQAKLVCDYGENCEEYCDDDICEYRWHLRHRHTMSWRTFDHYKGKFADYPLEWNDETEQLEIMIVGMKTPLEPPFDENMNPKDPMDDLENILAGDGREGRRVITINNQFPGPNLRARHGSIIKVKVYNDLPTEAVTVHWHGIHQTDNYWMDGAAYANQCPISAHQNYTYVFRAEIPGTFWYHSHNGIQRLDGIFGGLTIYDKDEINLGSDIELIMTDWFNVDYVELLAANPYNYAGTDGFLGNAYYHCNDEDKAYDHGVKVSSLCMDSLIVNGNGIYRNHFDGDDATGGVRETFEIPANEKSVKLRAIHAGFEFQLRFFRLDGGSMWVTGSDGDDFQPIEISEIIIGIGETFDLDLMLESFDEEVILRTQLMARCQGLQCDKIHIPYVDTYVRKSSSATEVTKLLNFDDPKVPMNPEGHCKPQEFNGVCNVFNCPWVEFNTEETNSHQYEFKKVCHHLTEAQRTVPTITDFDPNETPDKILNITFNFAHGSSINNIKFTYPKTPFYHPESEWGITECPEGIPEIGTKCTQIMDVELGDLVELRLIGAENTESEARRLMWTYHTFHLHGYNFNVMSMGFPITDDEGRIIDINPNMKCLNPSCTVHEWNETALELGRMSSSHHVSKNTLLIPAQGYVVARFRANNPGHWPLHCHNMMHNLEGMAIFLNVKDTKYNKPYSIIPSGLPSCKGHDMKETDSYPWEIEPKIETSAARSLTSTRYIMFYILICYISVIYILSLWR